MGQYIMSAMGRPGWDVDCSWRSARLRLPARPPRVPRAGCPSVCAHRSWNELEGPNGKSLGADNYLRYFIHLHSTLGDSRGAEFHSPGAVQLGLHRLQVVADSLQFLRAEHVVNDANALIAELLEVRLQENLTARLVVAQLRLLGVRELGESHTDCAPSGRCKRPDSEDLFANKQTRLTL